MLEPEEHGLRAQYLGLRVRPTIEQVLMDTRVLMDNYAASTHTLMQIISGIAGDALHNPLICSFTASSRRG